MATSESDMPSPPTALVTNNGTAPEPPRPPLRRDRSVPGPSPSPMPQTSHGQDALNDADAATDSLSLQQLKKLVSEMPKTLEPAPYAFVYSDCDEFQSELDEFFDVDDVEWPAWERCVSAFEKLWHSWQKGEWGNAGDTKSSAECRVLGVCSDDVKIAFLEDVSVDVRCDDRERIAIALECLVYLALGSWTEISYGQDKDTTECLDYVQGTSDEQSMKASQSAIASSISQVEVMRANINLIAKSVSVDTYFNALTRSWTPVQDYDAQNNHDTAEQLDERCRWSSLTLMYLLVDFATRDGMTQGDLNISKSIRAFDPKLPIYMAELLADSRWEDARDGPASKLIQLFWKSLLLEFGGVADADVIKRRLLQKDSESPAGDRPNINASPLDYHVFRQELISKYPAFNPPPPLFPLEPGTNSMLPFPQEQQSFAEQDHFTPADAGPSDSIIHQPVHIATPLPSPPPSPAGPGGKGIKKQNYQTNQMFPFLYPPLDESNGVIGVPGAPKLQDLLGARKWKGKDMPASILEAADLFVKRMHATRASKQLWEERVRFLKAGSNETSRVGESTKPETSESPGNNGISTEESLILLDDEERQRLQSVEVFYKQALPHLQSLVIVLMKVLLQTVTALITQPGATNGLQDGFKSPEQSVQVKPAASTTVVEGAQSNEQKKSTTSEIAALGAQEVKAKAVSAIIVLLLKWFKLSHVLKFEYLSILLLESNYLELTLKLFTHLDLEKAVNQTERLKGSSFLAWCRTRQQRLSPAGEVFIDVPNDPTEEAEEEAVPPPIKRQRDETAENSERISEDMQSNQMQDQLPPSYAPSLTDDEASQSPITNFCWKAFFTTINHLRILQKMIKGKPHRQLLMVQYKYSQMLKKLLKVTQYDIRLYTLKIIKGQIPYCPRKWRQGNMKIITAIYLHCKPTLRDDWLAGIDADQSMAEAMPAEHALMALTYWYHSDRYPDEFSRVQGQREAQLNPGEDDGQLQGSPADDQNVDLEDTDDDDDYFLQELERMELAGATISDTGRGTELFGPHEDQEPNGVPTHVQAEFP